MRWEVGVESQKSSQTPGERGGLILDLGVQSPFSCLLGFGLSLCHEFQPLSSPLAPGLSDGRGPGPTARATCGCHYEEARN